MVPSPQRWARVPRRSPPPYWSLSSQRSLSPAGSRSSRAFCRVPPSPSHVLCHLAPRVPFHGSMRQTPSAYTSRRSSRRVSRRASWAGSSSSVRVMSIRSLHRDATGSCRCPWTSPPRAPPLTGRTLIRRYQRYQRVVARLSRSLDLRGAPAPKRKVACHGASILGRDAPASITSDARHRRSYEGTEHQGRGRHATREWGGADPGALPSPHASLPDAARTRIPSKTRSMANACERVTVRPAAPRIARISCAARLRT